MASIRKEIRLNRQLFFGAWQTAMAGDHPAAFRLKKTLSTFPGVTYNRKAGTLKLPEDLPEEVTLHPYGSDVAWLWAQISKPLDGGRDPKTGEKISPSPAVVDLVTVWAEALGYDKDQSFRDRVQKFENWLDSEPKDETEEKKPEEPKAEAKPEEKKDAGSQA